MPQAPVVLVKGQVVTTTVPQLTVAGIAQPGVYTFELVVVDIHGIVSQPATVKVQVKAG